MRQCDLQGEEEKMTIDLLTDLSQVKWHGCVLLTRVVRYKGTVALVMLTCATWTRSLVFRVLTLVIVAAVRPT